MYLAQTNTDFKNGTEPSAKSSPSFRQEFLRLGAELHSRGQQPVAQFMNELAGLAPDLADEIRLRLLVYTKIPAAIYQALGADRFTPYIIAVEGGHK